MVGGLAVLTVAAIVVAQGPRQPHGFGPGGGMEASAVMIAAMPEVQRELSITEAQKERVDELQGDLQGEMQSLFRELPPPFEMEQLPPEERDAKFAEMRTKTDKQNAEFDAKLFAALESKQVDRLKQLQLQRAGVMAFSRKEVRDALALSDDQQKTLEELQRPEGGGFGPPRPRPEALGEFVKELSADQQAKWKTLSGSAFEFAQAQGGGFFGRGPGGFGGSGGGGPGGFGGEERKLVKQFDKNADGWLNVTERAEARKNAPARGEGRGPRGGGGFGGGREAGKPGPKVAVADVKPIENKDLYDPKVLRTLFIDFENSDWEAELESFHNSDVDVPATLTVDGKKYPNVGVHFRGASSYGMIPRGSKRSFNVSLDYIDDKQRLYGYKTLNLLNANGDPSFMKSALYSHIAREHLPCPKVNLVKVVVNGESWGVFANQQQVDKVFIKENYGKLQGTRWKVPGRPNGNGGLDYIGDKVDDYKRRYEMKSDDGDKEWQALIKLCKTLDETPIDQLEAALAPMLDLDEAMWFLALDNTLLNSDGYWTRASDYNLFLDNTGKFHLIPHDINETFQGGGGGGPGGPGGFGGPRGGGPDDRRGPEGRGGPEGGRPDDRGAEGRGPEGRGGEERGGGRRGGGGGGGYTLDPLVGMNDSGKPLRSRLLQVPSLRAKYLANVREIADKQLDWVYLGPLVADYKALIADEVEADTRKLSTFAAFEQMTADGDAASGGQVGGRGGSFHTFAKERRKFLLERK